MKLRIAVAALLMLAGVESQAVFAQDAEERRSRLELGVGGWVMTRERPSGRTTRRQFLDLAIRPRSSPTRMSGPTFSNSRRGYGSLPSGSAG